MRNTRREHKLASIPANRCSMVPNEHAISGRGHLCTFQCCMCDESVRNVRRDHRSDEPPLQPTNARADWSRIILAGSFRLRQCGDTTDCTRGFCLWHVQAQLPTVQRAIAQSFTMTLKKRATRIPAIHVAKKVIIMLSIAEKVFLFPLWTIIVFELGCPATAVAAS